MGNLGKIYSQEITMVSIQSKRLGKGFIHTHTHTYILLHFPEIEIDLTKPKISFVATVFNKEKYLSSFILSIQNQKLKEFELIFVDDCSTDKSLKIINNFKYNDKRIKLIKNKKNRGSLYARYNGAIHSKGEFIIFVDSDDIILKNGISNSYNHLKKNNLEMVQFHSVFEDKKNTFISRRYYTYSSIIYQPILSYIFFYKKNEGIELNTALWDKLIKREVVLKSIKYIGLKYLNERIIIENDVIILFSLFRNCNSFQYIDQLGYYYFIKNNDSITNTRFDPMKANQVIYSIFCNIKFIYEKTGNSYFEKNLCIYKLEQAYKIYKPCFQYLTKNFIFIKYIFNELLKSEYISFKKKLIIKKIKNEIFINKTLNLF